MIIYKTDRSIHYNPGNIRGSFIEHIPHPPPQLDMVIQATQLSRRPRLKGLYLRSQYLR
jgi:hypothetical protein